MSHPGQWENIKLFCKLWESGLKTLLNLNIIHGDEALKKSAVHNWYN
jgi:hypothetical protein